MNHDKGDLVGGDLVSPTPSYCTSHWQLIQILPVINQLTVPFLTAVVFSSCPLNSVRLIQEKVLLGVSKDFQPLPAQSRQKLFK